MLETTAPAHRRSPCPASPSRSTARLRLLLDGSADPATVRELLVREQGCCAFLGFTLTAGDGRLVADLEVPAEAAPALDSLAQLAELSAPWMA